MTARIFYSWQSDIKAAACRTLIEDALELAIKQLAADDAVEVVPVIDRDTLGVPGSPDIGATIFSKIDSASVIVADVTIVGKVGERATPNPNVLVELGYALRALGGPNVLLVQNTAFGGPELLPFDLRQKRVAKYFSPLEATERAPERKQLAAAFKDALTTILNVQPVATVPTAHERWQQLLRTALEGNSNRVEISGAVEMDVGAKDAAGRPKTFPAPLAGLVNVRDVNSEYFALGFPLKGQGGINIVHVPYELVRAIWLSPDGRTQIAFTQTLLFTGTARTGFSSSFT